MKLLGLALTSALLALLTAPPAAQAGRGRPNVVLILADDLGSWDLSCYARGGKEPPKVGTPHLDRLASEGVRLTDAHSPSSVCSPTRYAILTGRYGWRTELKRSVLWPWDRPLIEEGRPTLPGMLREVGYATACIGKWHLGWEWAMKEGPAPNETIALGQSDPAARVAIGSRVDFGKAIGGGPLTRGFDHYFGDDVPNFPPYAFFEDDRLLGEPTEAKPDTMFGHPGPMVPGWDLTAVMPKLTERAVAYVEERATDEADQPFFLFFTLTAPHTPIAPTPDFRGESEAGAYGDFVVQVDWTVGQVLDALERTGLDDDTLVIFTSDNGSPARDGTAMNGKVGSVTARFGHDPSGPLRGLKGDIWEGGHRVPFLARWPGQLEAGLVSNRLFCLVDLFATIASIVGRPLPEDGAEDSLDGLPILLDQEVATRDHVVHHSSRGVYAIRRGRWVLIEGELGSGGFSRPGNVPPKARGPQGQLYDLESDLAQQHDKWRKRQDVVKGLEAILEKLRSSGRTRRRG